MLPTLQKIKFKQSTPVCLSFQGRGLTINDQIQDCNFMNSIHFSVFNQMKEFWEDSDSWFIIPLKTLWTRNQKVVKYPRLTVLFLQQTGQRLPAVQSPVGHADFALEHKGPWRAHPRTGRKDEGTCWGGTGRMAPLAHASFIDKLLPPQDSSAD